jgi:transposase InsO family protein
MATLARARNAVLNRQGGIDRWGRRVRERYLQPPHPTAFAGINRVARHYGTNNVRAENLLNTVYSHTIHREYHKPRVRNPFYIYYRRQQIQIDLIDTTNKFGRENDGYRYLVCCIDCFSRYLWVRPTKTRDGREVTAVIVDMIEAMGDKPEVIFCDRGTEMKNRHLIGYLQNNDIKLMHPNTEAKAAIVERVNRTLQNMIHRYMTEKKTRRYMDKLQAIVESYNNRPHRSIGKLTPCQAELPENASAVVGALRQHYSDCKRPIPKSRMLKVGAVVRFKTNFGRAFARGYEPQFSEELFKVLSVDTRKAVPTYTIESFLNGDKIKGWHREELQPFTDQRAIDRALAIIRDTPHDPV